MWKIEELKIGMRGQRRVTNGGHSCASGVYHKPCPVLQHTVTCFLQMRKLLKFQRAYRTCPKPPN